MRLRCPTCYTESSVEAVLEDEAARDLMALLADQPRDVSRPLARYLGLFRPKTRALAWERALRLARETLALDADPARLGQALSDTVEAMRVKQEAGGWRPLTSHQYLSRVLESVTVRGVSSGPSAETAPAAPRSKGGQILQMLEAYPTEAGDDRPEWFVRAVCTGLRELVLRSLEGQPAADLWGEVIPHWINALYPRREWREDCRFRGAERLALAFRMTGERASRWPQPADILEHVPRA